MRLVLTAIGVASLALGGVAHAADCDQPYSTDQLLADLDAVERAAQGGQQGPAVKAASRLEAGLDCLEEKLVPMLIGRTYRSIGAGYLVGGNDTKGRAWFRTALEVDPAYTFGLEEYGYDNPVRATYEEIKDGPTGAPAAVAGKAFIDGDFTLDGRRLDSPEAIPGRPHLLQHSNGGVRSWIIQGNSFPDEVLQDAGGGDAVADAGGGDDKPAKDKKAKKKKDKKKKDKAVASGGSTTSSSGGTVVAPVRPPEKTPLLIAGGAVIAGAGAMFAGAVVSRQNFESITDSEESLRQAQSTTNLLYVGSIGVLAAGAGTLTWGIIIDGGTPIVRPRL